MPSERKIPPTTRRIKTTAFGALLRIIFIGEFMFSCRPHFQPKVTKFTADAKARKEGNIEQPTSNAQPPMEQPLGAVIGCSMLGCWVLDVFFLRRSEEHTSELQSR